MNDPSIITWLESDDGLRWQYREFFLKSTMIRQPMITLKEVILISYDDGTELSFEEMTLLYHYERKQDGRP